MRADLRLSDRERERLLREYDAIPRAPGSRRLRGEVAELLRRWRVSESFLKGLRKKAREVSR